MSQQESSPLRTCFIISPIGEFGSPERKSADFFLNGIARPAVERAGGFSEPIRADDVHNPGMITDDIIIKIHDADLVITDMSNLNPNVFYELGIRHAAAKPTIHCASRGTILPFDNKGYSTIFYDSTEWTSIEEARDRIIGNINAIFSENFKVTNPVTHALSAKILLASADPKEKMLAELSGRIENLEINIKSGRGRSNNLDSGSNFVSEILNDSLRQFERREEEIYATVNELKARFSKKLDDDIVKWYARDNAGPEKYMRFVNLVKSGKFDQILNEAEIPF